MKYSKFSPFSCNIILIFEFKTKLRDHLNGLDLCKISGALICSFLRHNLKLHSNLHSESFILLVFLLLIILYYDIQIIFSQFEVILKDFFIENFCIN